MLQLSGAASEGAKGSVELLLHRYLSRPERPGGNLVLSVVSLSSHMYNRLRYHYPEIHRSRVFAYTQELCRQQYCLFW